MAQKFVFKNAKFQLDNAAGSLVDLTPQVESITVNRGINTETANGMGDDTEMNLGTLRTWSMDVTFLLTIGTGSVEEILTAFYERAGAEGTIEMTTDKDLAVSAANPKFTGEAVLPDFGVGGDHGSQPRVTISFIAAGTLVRAIT